MRINSRLGLITCLVVVLVGGFAACGIGSGALAPTNGQAAPAVSTGAASTVTTSERTPEPTDTSAPSGGTTTGKVTLTLGAAHYAPTDAIAVAIDNGTASVISTADHQTECQEVSLQQFVDGGWQTQRQCAELSPTRLVHLAPGVTLQPLSPGSTPWLVGTYRIAFAYFVGADAGSGTGQASSPSQAQFIYSADFRIG